MWHIHSLTEIYLGDGSHKQRFQPSLFSVQSPYLPIFTKPLDFLYDSTIKGKYLKTIVLVNESIY